MDVGNLARRYDGHLPPLPKRSCWQARSRHSELLEAQTRSRQSKLVEVVEAVVSAEARGSDGSFESSVA